MEHDPARLPGWRAAGSADLDADQLAEELERQHALLRERLPDLDPGDLMTILHALLRPFGTGRRFFLRKHPGGGHVI